jgi:hypothetical protein
MVWINQLLKKLRKALIPPLRALAVAAAVRVAEAAVALLMSTLPHSLRVWKKKEKLM